MKFLFLVATISVSCMVVWADTDPECTKIPGMVFSDENRDCCKVPVFSNFTVIALCARSVDSDKKHDPVLRNCKIFECIVKAQDVMNGEQMDQTKTLAYLDTSIKDPIWNPVLKKAAVDCLTKVSGKLNILEKLYLALPNNKSPEECHVGILAFVECHMAEIYASCPPSAWTNTKNCNEVKDVVAKCNKNIENIINIYVSKIGHNHH